MKSYTPRNWYWIVAGDETRVYHTGSDHNFLPVADVTYIGWLADGTLPTRIASEAELGEVLAQARLRPVHAGVLDGYLERQSADVVDLVQFKVLFNHENRIRAIERSLSGGAAPPNLSAAQAKAAVKALL